MQTVVTLTCDKNEVFEKNIDHAASVIRQGGVVVFPTETSYGLAASIKIPSALHRIYEIKKRQENKPLLILISDISWLCQVVESNQITDQAISLMKRSWPGALTILLPARTDLPYALHCGTKKVGVRVSSNWVASRLVSAVGHPITATSANLAGNPPCFDCEAVKKQLVSPRPDFVVDVGALPPCPASTIVDATTFPFKIIRQGAISLTLANSF